MIKVNMNAIMYYTGVVSVITIYSQMSYNQVTVPSCEAMKGLTSQHPVFRLLRD